MKRIIIALGLIVISHAGAEAQNCCKCKKVIKHAHVVRVQTPKPVAPVNTPAVETQVASENCHMVPFQVCSINPDRRSISCYKTIDLADQTPYNDEMVTYTNELPGQATKPAAGTIIINAPAPVNYCKRNKEDNATICFSPGGLVRDENGFYHYR